jgi:hypothetical protein
VQSYDTNVLFTGRLLGFYKSSGSFETNDKTSCDLGIKGSGVSGLLNLQDFFDPGDHLMGTWIGRFVEIHDSILEILLERSLKWSRTGGNWSVMAR